MFEIDFVNLTNLINLVIRFFFNFLIIFIIGRFIYYPVSRKKKYLFTYLLLSIVIFLICYLLNSVQLELGMALGLFAIFGILRYRTNPIPIREMTYLFVVIGLSVTNSLAGENLSVLEILFANLFVIFITYGLEKVWFLKHEKFRLVNYEKIDLIKLQNYNKLIADLEERLGLKINRIEYGKVDFLNDTSEIKVYYYEEDQEIRLIHE